LLTCLERVDEGSGVFKLSVKSGFCLLMLCTSLSGGAVAQSEYAGSQQCMGCHERIYEAWKGSAHSNTVEVITSANDTVIADWRGEVKLKQGNIPEVTIRLARGPQGSYLVTLVDARDPSRSLTLTVVRTQGVGWIKGQQYHVEIDRNYYVLPFIWAPASSGFKAYFLGDWYLEDGHLRQPPVERTWAMTCAGCHQTGITLKESGEGYEVTYTDPSIGCEKCHGPGAAHVESAGDKAKIINPKHLSYARKMDVCNQCHSVGAGKSAPTGKFSFAWDEQKNQGYRIGYPLADYYRPVGSPPVQENGEPIVLNTYHFLSKSLHYEAGVACVDCHDPHGSPAKSQLVRAESDNSLCIGCHAAEEAFNSPTRIMQHTGHAYAPPLDGSSRCTGCHYVPSRRERIPSDLQAPGPAAGFLAIVTPQQSLEMFMNDSEKEYVNSCNRCHREWGGDEAGYRKGVAAYAAKFGPPSEN